MRSHQFQMLLSGLQNDEMYFNNSIKKSKSSASFTGCGRHQHQMLSWNCWLASVSVPASCQNVGPTYVANRLACTDINASCSPAVTRNDRQMKTTASNSVIQTMIYRSAVRCLTLMFDDYV